MKCVAFLSLIGGIDLSDEAQFQMAADYVPLSDVIPARYNVLESMPKKFRGIDASMDRRTQSNCTFPLDIVIVQDATASFSDNIAEMRNKQLEELFNGIIVTHPGSRFSVVSFRDKPITHFGGPSDYCLRFEIGFTTDLSDLQEAYTKIRAIGGMDPPENQFGAMMAAIKGSQWNDLNSEYARLVVVSTDAGAHHADDGEFDSSIFISSSGTWGEEDNERICLKEYYPSYSQMKDAIFDYQTYVAMLVFNGDWANNWPMRSWTSFNNYILQTPAFLQDMDANSSNFWFQLQKTITEMENIECLPDSTTPYPTESSTTESTTTPVTTPGTTTNSTQRPTTTPETTPDVTTNSTQTPTTAPVTATTTNSTLPGTTVECPDPTMITDAPCIPSAENCYCQPEVLVEFMEKPDSMKVVVNGTEIH